MRCDVAVQFGLPRAPIVRSTSLQGSRIQRPRRKSQRQHQRHSPRPRQRNCPRRRRPPGPLQIASAPASLPVPWLDPVCNPAVPRTARRARRHQRRGGGGVQEDWRPGGCEQRRRFFFSNCFFLGLFVWPQAGTRALIKPPWKARARALGRPVEERWGGLMQYSTVKYRTVRYGTVLDARPSIPRALLDSVPSTTPRASGQITTNVSVCRARKVPVHHRSRRRAGPSSTHVSVGTHNPWAVQQGLASCTVVLVYESMGVLEMRSGTNAPRRSRRHCKPVLDDS
ncbi:hypothetical protein PMIN03_006056 [Paraphaeosphaeria minitans]